MFLRSAAMATALTLGGVAFVAGAAAGAGLAMAGMGAACLARRAVKKRDEWGRDESAAATPAAEDMPDEGLPSA